MVMQVRQNVTDMLQDAQGEVQGWHTGISVDERVRMVEEGHADVLMH